MSHISVEIFDAKNIQNLIATIDDVSPEDTVLSLKKRIAEKKANLTPERQSLHLEAKGNPLKDEERVRDLNLPPKGGQLFVKDLGLQIGLKNVYLAEYIGPLFIYPLFYFRPSFIYDDSGESDSEEDSAVVTLALICWSAHFAKRLLEAQFVHRFSDHKEPLFNVIRASAYYCFFAAFVGYFINHPDHAEPLLGCLQVCIGLICFTACEIGNLSCHILLRNLRPEGSKERKVPVPDSNPFTKLFNYVSFPHYTYEFGTWLSFSVMSQSLAALIFAFASLGVMSWMAKPKHQAYLKEFPSYPRDRKVILPLIL